MMTNLSSFQSSFNLEANGNLISIDQLLHFSPVLVEEDANMMVTARRIIWSKFLNCGQSATAPDYLIMTQKTRKLLYMKLIQVVHEFYGEDVKESKDYGRVVNEKHFE